jgi:Tol biopolymer transport system component
MTRVSPGNSPLLAPDGRIAFTSGRKGGIADVYVRPAFGGGAEELLIGSPENKIVNDWSRDGRYIVFASTNVNTKTDLWVMPTSGGEAPAPFLATPFNEFQAQVSPDGKSLAYASDESGAWEVYVQSFPFPGDKRVVSNGGGSEPQWRRDGRELFYLAADGTLMSVDVRPGDSPQFSRPQPLFRTRIPQGEFNARRNHYAVAADGQRFLINTTGDAQESITVIVNWAAQLESQSAEP